MDATWRGFFIQVASSITSRHPLSQVRRSWIWIIPGGAPVQFFLLALGRGYAQQSTGCPRVDNLPGYPEIAIPTEVMNLAGGPQHGHRIAICFADLSNNIAFFNHRLYSDVTREYRIVYSGSIIPLRDVERVARRCLSWLLIQSGLDIGNYEVQMREFESLWSTSEEVYMDQSTDFMRSVTGSGILAQVFRMRSFVYGEWPIEVQLFTFDGLLRATCVLNMRPDDTLKAFKTRVRTRFPHFPFDARWKLFRLPYIILIKNIYCK